jgi:hypothetical protein
VFLRPIPKLTVAATSSAIPESVRAISSGDAPSCSRVMSVRIAALPQAMSKPTPTTETLSRYAATPPMGMT